MERFAVLGTAGHIDHGKTALVGLLTGVDTDRLKEEKARGISIDLGFAHLDLPGGPSCGIVDVPGHERFVKNMLAGAAGVDAVLLVIAADEGVMPQTREHLDIIRLLGVTRGVVALTKTDMVEPDWLDLARESVAEYLEDEGFGAFPIVPVSARTGEGKDELLATLVQVLSDFDRGSSEGPARLPVDRAFSVEGFGTVVTGTLWRGSIRVGDHLMVEPGGHEVRVRNVQVHGETCDEAHAGQRTAVAVHGVDRAKVPRGSWLVAGGSVGSAPMLDVRVRVLPDAPRPLRRRQRVRFHLGASEHLARVVPLEKEILEPGEEGFAQIRIEGTASAARGDRFVIRSYSPARTIAGGTVIVPDARKHKLNESHLMEELEREETGTPEDRLLAALRTAPGSLAPGPAAESAGLEQPEAEAALAKLGDEVRALSDGSWVAVSVAHDLGRRALSVLLEHQKKNPLRWGMTRGELKSHLARDLGAALYEAVIASLVESGEAHIRRDWIRGGAEDHELTPDLARRVDQVLRALEEGEFMPPTTKELEKSQGVPVLEVLEYLTFLNRVTKVTPELFLFEGVLERVGEFIRNCLDEKGVLAVGDLREGLGMSRKYSVPVLEFFDKAGWTRRQGDTRIAGRHLGDDPHAS